MHARLEACILCNRLLCQLLGGMKVTPPSSELNLVCVYAFMYAHGRDERGETNQYLDVQQSLMVFHLGLTESLVVNGGEKCFSFCMWNKNS